MLVGHHVQANIPAADLERAKSWYAEKLGFQPTAESPGGLTYEVGDGSGFFLYPSAGAGLATHTLMGFQTGAIEDHVRDLKAAGVVFEDYDMPGMKTEGSIASMGGARAAWFRDSENNIIGLFQREG